MKEILSTWVLHPIFALACLALGMQLTCLFYRCSVKHRKLFVLLGVFLMVVGSWLYWPPSTDAEKSGQLEENGSSDGSKASLLLDSWHSFVKLGVSGISSVNQAVSSFFPSRGGYDEKDVCKDALRPRWLYWGFHFLAVVYMISIGTAVFGVEWANRATLFFRGRLPFQFRPKLRFVPRLFNVFWGLDDEAVLMADYAAAHPQPGFDGKSTVFVLPESTGSWLSLSGRDNPVHALTRKGHLWILGDVSRPGRLKRARRHFFLSPDEHRNVALAEILMARFKASPPPHPVSLYVRTWTGADDDVIFQWAGNATGKLENVGLEVVREESIVSRQFLLDHPMLDCPGISPLPAPNHPAVAGGFNLLLVGFGVQGRRLLADMVCDAQFLAPDGRPVPLHVDVVDCDPAAFGTFRALCQTACGRYGMDFHPLDVRGEAFWTWLGDPGRPLYNRVVVATQDDVVNLDAANAISNHFAIRFPGLRGKLHQVVFARVRNPALSNALTRVDAPCSLFGNISETYSSKALLNDRWNAGALFINGLWAASYLEGNEGAATEKLVEWCKKHPDRIRTEWLQASAFNKESSLSSLLHQRNLLRLIGFDVRPAPANAGSAPSMPGTLAQIRERIRPGGAAHATLAQMEHMRWMAFHFLRGWQVWDPSPDELRRLAAASGKQVKPNSLKNSVHLHADLVDFDRLPGLDERFNAINREFHFPEVDSRAKDKGIVFAAEALFDAGFSVVPRPATGNTPGGEPS